MGINFDINFGTNINNYINGSFLPFTGTLGKIIMACSWRRNINKLTAKSVNSTFEPLNGAKVISMAAIIFGHRLLHSFGIGLYNTQDLEKVNNPM